MKYNLTLEIELDSGDKAKILAKALSYDKKENRSKIDIKAKGKILILNIVADDKTALRSAFNTNARLINSCLKCLEVR
ncbi:MAG: hypothetical protein J7K68_01055 [Candidatus Diapherotrites archaeon]|nr:hypothetical protein [Candidatus Diapherotrites archaeon]